MSKGKGIPKIKHDYNDPMLLAEVEGYARDGWDDAMIAEKLGVAAETFSKNKNKKQPNGDLSNLSQALTRGRRPLNVFVENSLYKRSMGMKVTTTKVIKKREYNPATEEFEINIYDETTITELPPDFSSIHLWLRNRKPEIWNGQPNRVDHTTNGKDMPEPLVFMSTDELTDEQIQAIIAKETGKNDLE